MESTELNVMLAAVGAFVLQELIEIRRGVKTNPESPIKFNVRYYLTQWRNMLNMAINALGSWVLFLGRHEVEAFASALPFVAGLGDTTPVLVGACIGFAGPWIVRTATSLLEKNTPTPDSK